MNKLEIINYALTLLGVDRIDSYDEDTSQAQVVRDTYPHLLREAFESFDWPFARTESAALAKTGESRQEREIYQLPTDLELLTRVFDAAGWEKAFHKVGNTIHLVDGDLGNTTLYVEYIALKDEGAFPQYFGIYIAKKLAAETCMTFRENSAMTERLEKMAADQRRVARRLANQQGGGKLLAPDAEYSMINGRR